jgi:hypothetical protein
MLLPSAHKVKVFFLTFQVKRTNMQLVLFGVICLLALGFAAKDEKNKDVGTVIGIDLGTTYSW